jgi:CheY-like chemotaxis protein
MMPGLNGIELLKRLRRTPPFEKLPVVVYTNAFIPQMVAEAKLAGATEVFDKSTLLPSMLVDAFKTATECDRSPGETK